MYLVLGKKNKEIIYISTTMDYQENGNPLVDNGTLAISVSLVDSVVEVDNIPKEVEVEKYCYIDGQYIINPDWVEPDPVSTVTTDELLDNQYTIMMAIADIYEQMNSSSTESDTTNQEG